MDEIHFLTKEEHENLGFSNPVSPRTLEIEIPKNVPSKVKPIVIFPTTGYKEMTVKVTQFDENYNGTTFETVLNPNQSHIINLNTGVE